MSTELLDPPLQQQLEVDLETIDEYQAELNAGRPDLDAIYEAYSQRRLGEHKFDWVSLGWIAAMHVGCLAAPFYFTWQALGVMLVLHWMSASLGICLGYHRYLSHRSLKLAWPAEFFVLYCAAISGEGSPLTWAGTHRLHHQRSDLEGDPHSPLEGKWWSHLLWLFVNRTPAEQEAISGRYVPELPDRPLVRFFERTWHFWMFGTGVLLYLVGGLPVLLWGLCVRMVMTYHSTWFVNSATHLWGYRNYETRDQSRNLWWVALLAYGEGWHNNHHAHPRTARAGHKWWEVDMTWWSIRALELCGLATEVDDRNPGADADAGACGSSVDRAA